MFNYENVVPAVDMLLATLTGATVNKARVQAFAVTWLKGNKVNVVYTPKSLALASPGGTLQVIVINECTNIVEGMMRL